MTRSDRSRPVLALALALPLAAACAHAPAPTPAADPLAASTAATSPERATAPAATGVASPSDAPDALAPLRAEVDALLTAQGEAAWRGWTGDGPLELTAAAAGREKLLDPAALETVEAARRAATGPARRAADQLRAFLVGERLARASARQAQALASARAAATFTWDKRQVPLRRLPALLAAEPEAARRQALAEAHAAAAAKLGPLVTAREAALGAAATQLGFEGTLPAAEALRGEPIEALAALAEATLARTEATWRALLDALARQELQAPTERLRERDLPRLLRTTADPRAFPAQRLVADAEATLAGLGLELAAGGRVTVDAAARPGQVARPLCVPLEVPGRIRLAVPPLAGLDAARALLHELGVAQAAAHVTEPGVEARRLGPAALPDAWGRLLEAVAASPEWLGARGLDAEAARREARVAAARRLHEARRAAARIIAEVARARSPAGGAAAWAAVGPRALGHPLDPAAPPPWSTDPDPLFEAAETLRAVLLAAQVEARLGEGPGEPWWRRTESGAWLRAAWARGAARLPDELARDLGAAGLDPGPLDALTRRLAAAGGLELPPPATPSAPGPGTSIPSSTASPPGG